MQRADLIFNTKRFAENMRKWMELYDQYDTIQFLTSQYFIPFPEFPGIIKDIDTLVEGNFANESQLKEILNFCEKTRDFFYLYKKEQNLIHIKNVPSEEKLNELINGVKKRIEEINQNKKDEIEKRKKGSELLQEKLTDEEKEELKKKKEEWQGMHYNRWLVVNNDEALKIQTIVDMEKILSEESVETRYAKVKQAMSEGLWADSLPVEFYSEAEVFGRRHTITELIVQSSLPNNEIMLFYLDKASNASLEEGSLWLSDQHFFQHQLTEAMKKEVIQQETIKQETIKQETIKQETIKQEVVKEQEKIKHEGKEVKKENLTVGKAQLEDKFFQISKNFDYKITRNNIRLPDFLDDELIQIQKLSSIYKNTQDIQNVAESNKSLYNRYRLVLFNMWQNFSIYFKEMDNVEKNTLKRSLRYTLLDEGMLKEDENKFLVKKETLDQMKSESPFSFHYQSLRMKLNNISQNKLDLYDGEQEIIDALYEKIDAIARRQDKNETEKFQSMNSMIISFYLELSKDFRKYSTTKALKDYILKLSTPAADSINDSYKAEDLFNNIYTKLTALPTYRVNDKNALIKKIEEINNSNNNDELKVAKLRIALRDAIEKVGSTMWGKPSLFGAGSKLYKGLMELEQEIIQQENKLDKKPARHMKDKKK